MATYSGGFGSSSMTLSFDGTTPGTTGVFADETRWTIHEQLDIIETPMCQNQAQSGVAWVSTYVGWRRFRATVDFLIDSAAADDFYDGATVRMGNSVTVWARLTANDTYKGSMWIEEAHFVVEPHGLMRGTLQLRGNGALAIE